jgi:plastocyanin
MDNDYQPRTRTVTVGSTVSWINRGQLPHTVTAAGQFDSGFLMNGDSWSRTFNSAGTFNYTCTIHPEMTGTILVTGTGGEPPPPGGNQPPGDDPASPSAPPPPSRGGISMIDNDYQPRSRTVSVGSTVSWVNNGQLPHTVTAAGQFDSGILMSGDTWSRTFNSAGTFDYVCTLHPEMQGTIVVAGSSGEAPPSQDEETDPPAGIDAVATDQPEPSPAPPPSSVGVDMVDNAYAPAAIEVRVGDSITWVNRGQLPHTVTARDGSFDSGFLMTNESWTMRFDQVGTVEYFCIIHPEMVGTISVIPIVGDSDREALAAASQPTGGEAESGTSAQPVTAGVSGPAAPTEAAIVVILLFVILTVGFIVFLAHEVDFAPASAGDHPATGDQD